MNDLNTQFIDEALFFEVHAVIVPNNEKYYYKYNCYIETFPNGADEFLIFNEENAINLGYKEKVCN